MKNRSFVSEVLHSVYSKPGINILQFYVIGSIISSIALWFRDSNSPQTHFFLWNTVFAATLAFLLYAGLYNHRTSLEKTFYDRIKNLFDLTASKQDTKEQLIQVKWTGLNIVGIKVNDPNPNGRISREGSLWKDVVTAAVDVFNLEEAKAAASLQELPAGKMTVYVQQNETPDEALFFAEIQYVQELHDFVYSDNFAWGSKFPTVDAALYARPVTSTNFSFNDLIIQSDVQIPNETAQKFQTMFAEKYQEDRAWNFVNSDRMIKMMLDPR